MKIRDRVSIFMGEEEYQGMNGWKVESDRGASLTKTGLVGAIKQSGRKLDRRIPGTG